MSDATLDRMRDLIQEDVGQRGLCKDPERNLVNACPDDFRLACRSLAEHKQPTLAVVTGFFIPTGQPPSGETDGPLGALFLARALTPLGMRVVLLTDDFCAKALQRGVESCGLRKQVSVVTLPKAAEAGSMADSEYQSHVRDRTGPVTHLLAIERVGPSHTLDSLRRQAAGAAVDLEEIANAIPAEHQDRCHTMRGRDITALMSPAHRLFEGTASEGVATIGIGDGGNEIGMGKIGWDVIRRNIPNGGMVACRIATQHLIVCGVSNWGAYALAAGVGLLRGAVLEDSLFDPDKEQELLQTMVDAGPLVDGVTGEPTATVDGLPWDRYAAVLPRLKDMCHER